METALIRRHRIKIEPPARLFNLVDGICRPHKDLGNIPSIPGLGEMQAAAHERAMPSQYATSVRCWLSILGEIALRVIMDTIDGRPLTRPSCQAGLVRLFFLLVPLFSTLNHPNWTWTAFSRYCVTSVISSDMAEQETSSPEHGTARIFPLFGNLGANHLAAHNLSFLWCAL